MANIDRIYGGFQPALTLGGARVPVWRFPVLATHALNLFVGDVVEALSTGNIQEAAADAGVSTLGVVVAIYDTTGNPIGSPNSSISTKYLPALSGGYADVALALPDCVFRGQGDTTGTAPASTDLFSDCDWVAGTGDTTIARSGYELDSSHLATAGTETGCKIIGLVDEPNNSWGEHCEMYFVFAESYWFSGTTASAAV